MEISSTSRSSTSRSSARASSSVTVSVSITVLWHSVPREVTSKAELERAAFDLFGRHGFERTTIDDIASAAGIGRRTFFRYFPSKNDVVWGDFDTELAKLRHRLASTPQAAPLMETIRREIVEFNRIAPEQVLAHRQRMDLILRVRSLQAHSTLRYAAWRQVIADFVADRTGQRADALVPQAIGYATLGAAIAAYEQWLRGDESADLCELLDAALSALAIAEPSARATGGGKALPTWR
jgi:mycofactocin system transcriptional regulator